MAAPPAKQYTSHQAMKQSEESSTTSAASAKPPPPRSMLKDPPPSSLSNSHEQQSLLSHQSATPMPMPISTPTPMPTYHSSETSESYRLAKQLLNIDNFEEALAIVEQQLVETTAAIRSGLGVSLSGSISNNNSNNNNISNNNAVDQDSDLNSAIDLHESLAPLHYLYGTTLLYSLEEARDDGTDTGAMVTTAAVAATAGPSVAASPDPSNPWAHLGNAGETTAASASNDAANNMNMNNNNNMNNNMNNNNNNNNASFEMAEDIQIAWENLEAARTIVEKMLLQTATIHDRSDQEVAKLQLDLAQIHLREGDLQRINGNYTSAVGDYSSCLEILQRHNGTKDQEGNPRNLDRKIADTQFNLGLTYLTSSSDLQKELANASASGNASGNANASASATASASGNANASAAAGNGGEVDRGKIAQLARKHCDRGIQQQIDCAKTFCGILAGLCGVEPESIWNASSASSSASSADRKPSATAGFKTTGLDDNDDNNNKNDNNNDNDSDNNNVSPRAAAASQTLRAWRNAVSSLRIGNADDDTVARVQDIRQLLDEIQETIDEADRSREGVRQAAEIRVRAQQAVAGLGETNNDKDKDNEHQPVSTTTIGFGAVPTTSMATATSATSATTTPMMVVKKKKKRAVNGDSAAETTNPTEQKRARTSG